MNDWIVPIVVAILGSPLVMLIQKGRKENQLDHASVMTMLTETKNSIDKVDTKLDGHIDWHMHRKVNEEVVVKAD
jgi:hypothetical protein